MKRRGRMYIWEGIYRRGCGEKKGASAYHFGNHKEEGTVLCWAAILYNAVNSRNSAHALACVAKGNETAGKSFCITMFVILTSRQQILPVILLTFRIRGSIRFAILCCTDQNHGTIGKEILDDEFLRNEDLRYVECCKSKLINSTV